MNPQFDPSVISQTEWTYAFIVVIISFVLLLVSLYLRDRERGDWWTNLTQGLASDFLVAVFTAILLIGMLRPDEINLAREDIVRQLGSGDLSVTANAVDMLREDRDFDLSGENLYATNAEGLNMSEFDFSGADLRFSILRDTILIGANFSNTNLRSADFACAVLDGAIFDRATALPNGDLWTPNTDMGQFTDPTQLDFWRAELQSSPAFSGNPTPEC